MKAAAVIFTILSTSYSAFAGIPAQELTKVLEIPKVQQMLSTNDQEITSIKVVYDKPGRAAFDFTIVACGVASTTDANGNEGIAYITTRIDGRFAFVGDREGNELSQVSSPTKDASCK